MAASHPGFVIACSALAGDPVMSHDGEPLGTLERVMIEVATGRIAYGVLAHGGVLGLGAKLVAIPWRALLPDVQRRCFILDASADELRGAPEYQRPVETALP
jgi:sporulation protein YlmC with PRC-barrel domain